MQNKEGGLPLPAESTKFFGNSEFPGSQHTVGFFRVQVLFKVAEVLQCPCPKARRQQQARNPARQAEADQVKSLPARLPRIFWRAKQSA
jgi:hypothetical protein